jgi:invasion protein IalB
MPPGDPAYRGEPLVYSPWAKFCGKSQQATGTEVCFTGKDGRTKAGQAMLAAALIEPAGEAKKLFRITLPNSVQLQYGARLIIDQDQPISGAFFTCFANGCNGRLSGDARTGNQAEAWPDAATACDR